MSLAFEFRKRSILEKLVKEKQIYVPELAKTLNVSSETIRRDLERLEKEGKLKKVYGGAILASSRSSWEPPFDQKITINSREKQAIGKLAASIIEDGDIIMIGNGTTTLGILDYLENKKNITLITHSTPVMLSAIEKFKGHLIFIGGEVDMNQKSTHGPLAALALRQLKANKAFISAGGVSNTDGVTDYDLNEANMSRLLLERSDELIVLADHTKLGATTFAHICSLDDISTLISDRNCPQDLHRLLADKDVELMVAEEDKE